MSNKFSSWISSLDCSLKLLILHTTVRHYLEVNIRMSRYLQVGSFIFMQNDFAKIGFHQYSAEAITPYSRI